MKDRRGQIDMIKQANDIVAVVGGYISLKPHGQTYKGLCPFHEDNRPSFDVDPRRQRYRCWACGNYGDVISFIQEHEHVSFMEAVELLAHRAGISLQSNDETQSKAYEARMQMFEVMQWAWQIYHECYLDDPEAEAARAYLGSRHLLGPTARTFGVGYAPASGDWLTRRASKDKVSFDLLEQLGLIAKRTHGPGYYDRFRERVLFPIRNLVGQPIGFGGRILPQSPVADRAPKYYNSPDTPLFNKSEVLFGLDQARTAASKAGFLAVVEGYTDVLMAHQCGIPQTVATMGTALTTRHVQQLRRFVPKVILVFDADAGGSTGVDRALEIFASQEVELLIATLPDKLDPCDLLSQPDGVERFEQCLRQASDALTFKLEQVLQHESMHSIEGQRRAVEAVLGVLALTPELPGQAGAVKRELIVSRIARRLMLKEETVWSRLEEIRRNQRRAGDRHESSKVSRENPVDNAQQQAPSAPEERQLIEVLLAEPDLVEVAAKAVRVEEIKHPGLRKLLEGLYALQAAGEPPTLDQLRPQLENRLAEWAMKQQDLGHANPVNRTAWLDQIVGIFRQRKVKAEKQELQDRLQTATDHDSAKELLRRLQNNE